MFREILYPNQEKIIRILSLFWKDFYLAGGTSIALQLWHRKSLDFDFFSTKKINAEKIINTLKKEGFNISRILVDNKWEELTIIIDWVKLTFLYYPFEIKLENKFEWIKLPDLNSLCAMKFYTLWRRSKWKDYVDIYCILKKFSNFLEISKLASKIFDWAYNEKLLREQLVYFKDLDYTEEVEFILKWPSKPEIQDFLKKIAIS